VAQTHGGHIANKIVKKPRVFIQNVPRGYFGGTFQKWPACDQSGGYIAKGSSMYPLGNVWTNRLRNHNVTSMCPLDKCPLAPSVTSLTHPLTQPLCHHPPSSRQHHAIHSHHLTKRLSQHVMTPHHPDNIYNITWSSYCGMGSSPLVTIHCHPTWVISIPTLLVIISFLANISFKGRFWGKLYRTTLSVEVTAGGGKELRDKRPPLQVYIPRQCEKILPNEEIYQIGKDYIIVI